MKKYPQIIYEWEETAMTVMFLNKLQKTNDQRFDKSYYEKWIDWKISNKKLKKLLWYAIRYTDWIDMIVEKEKNLFYICY
jgi:hypothetical protein